MMIIFLQTGRPQWGCILILKNINKNWIRPCAVARTIKFVRKTDQFFVEPADYILDLFVIINSSSVGATLFVETNLRINSSSVRAACSHVAAVSEYGL